MQWRIEAFQGHPSSLARPTIAALREYLHDPDFHQRFGLRSLRWLFGGLLVLVASQWVGIGGAAVDCQATPFAFRPGTQSDVTMRVKGSRSCNLAARIGSARIENLIIESPPQYGGLQLRGRTGVVYRTGPGHKGDDSFVIALSGRRNGEAGSMLVRIKVKVD
jgi:hypothetical protein